MGKHRTSYNLCFNLFFGFSKVGMIFARKITHEMKTEQLCCIFLLIKEAVVVVVA